jgi:hypothetical protein
VNGVLALVAPSWLARRLGVDPKAQPAMAYPFRMFGIRTILIGADLFLRPDLRRRSLRQAVLIHGSDTAAALITTLKGELPLRQALMAVAISMTNLALAVVAVKTLKPSANS